MTLKIHVLSRHWKAKGPTSVSARIRQRKSKKITVVKKGSSSK